MVSQQMKREIILTRVCLGLPRKKLRKCEQVYIEANIDYQDSRGDTDAGEKPNLDICLQ